MATRRVSTVKHGDFTLFYRTASPFSNFYPCSFKAKGMDDSLHRYNCSEQYFMYNKALVANDTEAAASVLECTDPKDMKAIGRNLTTLDVERWKVVSLDVMRTALRAKFSQDAELLLALFLTHGSRCVECAPNDRIWGIGLAIDHGDAANPTRWRGSNQLGMLLDDVRQELWNDSSFRSTRDEVEKRLRDANNYANSYFASEKSRESMEAASSSEIASNRDRKQKNQAKHK